MLLTLTWSIITNEEKETSDAYEKPAASRPLDQGRLP